MSNLKLQAASLKLQVMLQAKRMMSHLKFQKFMKALNAILLNADDV